MIMKWRAPFFAVMMLLVAAMLGIAAEADLSLETTLSQDVFLLGEPISIDLTLTNEGEADVIHEDGYFSKETLESSILVLVVLPDGARKVIVSDTPISIDDPIPAPLPGEEPGQLVPATIISPQETKSFVIENLLRSIPFLKVGLYELRAFLVLPIYDGFSVAGEQGAPGLVNTYDAELLAVVGPLHEFSVTAPDDVAEDDLTRLLAARIAFGIANTEEEATGEFIYAQSESTHTYVQACSGYWIGEAYERFAQVDDAVSAYESVLESYAESVFALYAEQRLAQLTRVRE